METLESIGALARVSGPVSLCIGVFDGVHLGHRAVIAAGKADASSFGASLVVATFDPHPARVLRPDKAPRLLTSTPHKIALIGTLDVPFLLKIRFDESFAANTPEAFIDALVSAGSPLKSITVGHDWAFGSGRRGNVSLLRELGVTSGFHVSQVDAVLLDGIAISSTRIRQAVQSGDLALAERCLGRPFSILGTVVAGDQIGRTLGFPTANLRAHNEQYPPNGVYAVRVRIGDHFHDGVANIGTRPTLTAADPERRLEVHLLDYEGDLYGSDIEPAFLHFLRPERRFENTDALRAQISSDVEAARAFLRTSTVP